MTSDFQKGFLFSVGSFVSWGVLPIYWKHLGYYPPFDLVWFRMLSTAGIMALILMFWTKKRRFISQMNVKVFAKLWLSGTMLSINWLVYVWAILDGRVLECSLGYYINPLVNVFLGAIVLKERLHVLQKSAVALAMMGVGIFSIGVGTLPWVSLVLAGSFGVYGLLKKTLKIEPISAFTVESVGMLSWVLLATLWLDLGAYAWQEAGSSIPLYLALASTGLVTVIPMLMYNIGVQLIPLGLIGMLQFLAPTIKFLLGVLVFNEPFGVVQLLGFIFIWFSLVLYVAPTTRFLRPRAVC
ncbi:EamA family transporter RarD [Pseudobacteriovorax antillogorgiicola]|uniref:Chloramphenicol-sensitive protein RarD n=1 Tax=Pseudobacteriovorax antillogorgiicola TaxID=1513793 RepID=A0A1Y6CN76_9BACT|nr:EamA family transporter RarD [Pseudobacteriovorax antillogorgiicola]TCS46970.1 chloramphenicol-sensitive protein RarD [Pseudobacteriovorax antillogorgiicola]SMF64659.1 chloramphenicol-sensitive protein RarD [Pseudobacteriovorax antillogorgiicola]